MKSKDTIIRLFTGSEPPPIPHKPTKMPIGSKTCISSLQDQEEDENEFTYQNELNPLWNFSTFNSILSSSAVVTKAQVVSALHQHILYLSKIRKSFSSMYNSLGSSNINDSSIESNSIKTHVTFDSEILPPTPETIHSFDSSQPIQIFPQSPRSKKRTEQYPEVTTSRSINSNTIWHNTQKFFQTIPTYAKLEKYLKPSKRPDTNIQLGPHYSISINEKLRKKFSNGNVLIRLPSSILDSPEHTKISATEIFHRLLSSFVPVNDYDNLDSNKISDSNSELNNHNNHNNTLNESQTHFNDLSSSDFRHSIQNSSSIPTEVAGTTLYSRLPFEQKLMMEVEFLDLKPNSSIPRMADNEVMSDILEKAKIYSRTIRKTNKIKKQIIAKLLEKEPLFRKREEQKKEWSKFIIPPETLIPKDSLQSPKQANTKTSTKISQNNSQNNSKNNSKNNNKTTNKSVTDGN